jgi:hypothetical protein
MKGLPERTVRSGVSSFNSWSISVAIAIIPVVAGVYESWWKSDIGIIQTLVHKAPSRRPFNP